VCGDTPDALWSELWKRSDAPHLARRWFTERLLALEPVAEPGTKFVYSNQGFTIAGAMLEARAGKPWEELMREHVFAPLGMASAGFGAPGSTDAVDQPRGHRRSAVQPGPKADNPPAIGPAGTVHGSLRDWAKFISAHLAGERGGGAFLAPETFRKLHEPAPISTYAMGWNRVAREWAGGDVLMHAGSNTMWYCVVWIAPAKDHAFLAATNIGGDKAAKACDAAIAAMLKTRKLL
jgi:CubicO group peptidase (beta-lactamase class C family)